MNTQQYGRLRLVTLLFMVAVVLVSLWLSNYLLAAAGLLTGLLFLALVRSGGELAVDEREQTIREKAAAATYAIYAGTIGGSAVLLLLFAGRGFVFLEALGLLLAYLTLFLIALYAVSHQFFKRKYGGGGDEE
jgi:uncharacterized membrane protein